MSTLSQPGFEQVSGFDHVHAGNDSVAENGKSNEGEKTKIFTTGDTGGTQAKPGGRRRVLRGTQWVWGFTFAVLLCSVSP